MATVPTAETANDASVWLYNNLQKSPNQYGYHTNDLNPIRSDNISRDGNKNNAYGFYCKQIIIIIP